MCMSAAPRLALIVALMAAGLAPPSFAQAITQAPQAASLAPLDGQTFDAGIVRQADASPTDPLLDQLFFADGMFSSKICERYGFVPGPYWVRGEPDAIEFQAVLHSPTDGIMEWQGTVKDGKLDGTMRWTRERWYWTVEAEHRISGELSPQAPAPGGSD